MIARHELIQRYSMFVPRVDRKTLPITVVAMQYCADAGTALLPAIAHTGNRSEIANDTTIRMTRTVFLLTLSNTGYVMLAEFGFTEAYSTFEHVLISGSDSQGVIRNEQMIVQMKTDTKSRVSMTSAFLNLSSCL